MEGFEPPNGGIKTRCLTTWRHPNAFVTSARRRRPAPAPSVSGRPAARNCKRAASGDRLRPRVAQPCHPAGLPASTASACATSAITANTQDPVPVRRAVPKRPSQSSAPAHSWVLLAHHGFAVVPTTGLQETGNCEHRRIPCQFRGFEHIRRADGHVGPQQQVHRFGEVDWHEPFTDSLRPGRPRMHEDGHVGAQFEAQFGQSPAENPVPHSWFNATSTVAASELPLARPRPPSEAAFRPRLPPPASGTRRSRRRPRPQPPRGAHGQVLVCRHACQRAQALDDTRRPLVETDRIPEIDELKGRLQLVVAVGPPANDVQEQVQLAGRGPGRAGCPSTRFMGQAGPSRPRRCARAWRPSWRSGVTATASPPAHRARRN